MTHKDLIGFYLYEYLMEKMHFNLLLLFRILLVQCLQREITLFNVIEGLL